MIEELLGWLASSENALLAMEEDPLPPEGPIIEEMLREHQVKYSPDSSFKLCGVNNVY